jgi:hypothetical protein
MGLATYLARKLPLAPDCRFWVILAAFICTFIEGRLANRENLR